MLQQKKQINLLTLEQSDNANAEYNDVGGNQYNDNAIHNQGGDD